VADELDVSAVMRRMDYRSSCLGKARYTRQEARREASARSRGHERYNAYRCKWCPAWHVGHVQGTPRPKKPVKLLVAAEAGRLSVAGFQGDRVAGAAVYGGAPLRAPFPDGADGFFVVTGHVIFSSRGRTCVVSNNVRQATAEDAAAEWKTGGDCA